jgi:hypothetical protein
MNCYVCAVTGTKNSAVGICGVCSIGLCLTHIGENARRHRGLGAYPNDCLHHPGYDGDPPRITRIPITVGHERPPAA